MSNAASTALCLSRQGSRCSPEDHWRWYSAGSPLFSPFSPDRGRAGEGFIFVSEPEIPSHSFQILPPDLCVGPGGFPSGDMQGRKRTWCGKRKMEPEQKQTWSKSEALITSDKNPALCWCICWTSALLIYFSVLKIKNNQCQGTAVITVILGNISFIESISFKSYPTVFSHTFTI